MMARGMEILIEAVVRFVLLIIIWLLLIVPASAAVFFYQLLVRRSFSQARRLAWRVARDIMENTTMSHSL